MEPESLSSFSLNTIKVCSVKQISKMGDSSNSNLIMGLYHPDMAILFTTISVKGKDVEEDLKSSSHLELSEWLSDTIVEAFSTFSQSRPPLFTEPKLLIFRAETERTTSDDWASYRFTHFADLSYTVR